MGESIDIDLNLFFIPHIFVLCGGAAERMQFFKEIHDLGEIHY